MPVETHTVFTIQSCASGLIFLKKSLYPKARWASLRSGLVTVSLKMNQRNVQETCVPNNVRPGGNNTATLAISLFPSLSIITIYTSPSNIAARRTALQYSVFRLQSPSINAVHATSVQSQHWISRFTERRTPPANAWAVRSAISLRCSSKGSEEFNNHCVLREMLYEPDSVSRRSIKYSWEFWYAVRLYNVAEPYSEIVSDCGKRSQLESEVLKQLRSAVLCSGFPEHRSDPQSNTSIISVNFPLTLHLNNLGVVQVFLVKLGTEVKNRADWCRIGDQMPSMNPYF